MPDDPDLTIPGPLRMVWRADDYGPGALFLGAFYLGCVMEITEEGKTEWMAWLEPDNDRPPIRYPTETAARAALVAAVREAING